MMVLLWGCMIHFFVPNQKWKMQCNFIMNRSIASGPHTTPKIDRTRLTKNQKGLIYMYICVYKHIHIHVFPSLPHSFFIFEYHFFFLLLTPFLSLFMSLLLCSVFSGSVYASFSVSLCLCLQPFHSLTLMPSLGLYPSVSLSFFIPACLVFLAKYLSLFYYFYFVNLSLFP